MHYYARHNNPIQYNTTRNNTTNHNKMKYITTTLQYNTILKLQYTQPHNIQCNTTLCNQINCNATQHNSNIIK